MEKEEKVKQLLKEARLSILKVQEVIRPIDERYFTLDKVLVELEAIIMKKWL